MSKNNREAYKDVLRAFIAIIISLTVYKTLGQLTSSAIGNSYYAAFAAQLIFAVPVFIAVLLLKKTDIYRTDTGKLKKNWTAGLPFILISLLSSLGIIFGDGAITAGPAEILLFVLQMFLIGYCEETLYRGLLQNAFHRLFGERSLFAVRKAVFMTGVIFGLSHLLNALNPNITLGTAVLQAIGTCAMGCCMCAVYYRTGRSLWFMVALHAINDGVICVRQGVLAGVPEADAVTGSTASGLVYAVVPTIFYGLIALFLVRRKKVGPLLEKA